MTQQLPKHSGVPATERSRWRKHKSSFSFLTKNMLDVNCWVWRWQKKMEWIIIKQLLNLLMSFIRHFLNLGSTEEDVLCWTKGSHQNISNIQKYHAPVYYLYLSFPMLKEQLALTTTNDKNQNCRIFSSGTVVQKIYFIPSRTKNIAMWHRWPLSWFQLG